MVASGKEGRRYGEKRREKRPRERRSMTSGSEVDDDHATLRRLLLLFARLPNGILRHRQRDLQPGPFIFADAFGPLPFLLELVDDESIEHVPRPPTESPLRPPPPAPSLALAASMPRDRKGRAMKTIGARPFCPGPCSPLSSSVRASPARFPIRSSPACRKEVKKRF